MAPTNMLGLTTLGTIQMAISLIALVDAVFQVIRMRAARRRGAGPALQAMPL